jgi:hypothetical protein
MTGVATTFPVLDFVKEIGALAALDFTSPGLQRSLPTTVVAASRYHPEFIRSKPTLAEPLAPNFAGVKYTGMYTYPGMVDAQRIMNYKEGKFEVLSGREEMMLEALSIGIKGHVGSQFNFAGDLYNGIRNTFAREGLTDKSQAVLRGMQTQAVSLIDAWKNPAPVGVNGAKYYMNLAGKRSARGALRGPSSHCYTTVTRLLHDCYTWAFSSLATRAPTPNSPDALTASSSLDQVSRWAMRGCRVCRCRRMPPRSFATPSPLSAPMMTSH